MRSARKVEEMRSLSLIKLKRAGQRLEHAFRHPVPVPALEAGVRVDADPGEERDLFPADSWNAPGIAADA